MMVPEDIQDSILIWFLYPVEEMGGKKILVEPTIEDLQKVFFLLKNEKLTHRQCEIFQKWIEERTINDLSLYKIPIEYYVDRVIKALSVTNWNVQNPAAIFLWNIGPSGMIGITSEQMEQLGRNILQSADGFARYSISFLKKSITNNIKWPKSFVEGVLYESFVNESLKFRCKYNFLFEAILLGIRCCSEETKELFVQLLNDIDKSTLKYGNDQYTGENKSVLEINRVMDTLSEDENNYKDILIKLKDQLEERIRTIKSE